MKSFVPFAFGALMALALAGCSPSNNSNTAVSANTSAQTPNEAADNSAVITDSTPTTTQSASPISTIWVPGADDKLHMKSVSKASLDAQKKFGNPTAALNEIIKMSPKYFPPKTQVLGFTDDGKSVSVNLNKNLENSDFWSKAGENTTRLALYSIINTAATATNQTKPVVLKTENKPVGEIGQMSMDGEIEPDLTLEAKAGGPSTEPTAGSKAGDA